MVREVLLRDVTEADLPTLFEQQLDPEASRMAAFASRDRDAFMAHWEKILGDATLDKQVIVCDGRIAGNIGSFEYEGQREIGYWLGREFWGQGIATRALAAFLERVDRRPLFAYAATHNVASRRVLEKCGFVLIGRDEAFTKLDSADVPGFIFRLDAGSGA